MTLWEYIFQWATNEWERLFPKKQEDEWLVARESIIRELSYSYDPSGYIEMVVDVNGRIDNQKAVTRNYEIRI